MGATATFSDSSTRPELSAISLQVITPYLCGIREQGNVFSHFVEALEKSLVFEGGKFTGTVGPAICGGKRGEFVGLAPAGVPAFGRLGDFVV